jgi:hypothetical protein
MYTTFGSTAILAKRPKYGLSDSWRAFSFLEANVRNVARIKLGYYPLPQEEAKRLRKLLEFSAGTLSVVDPCVGTGSALHQLTEGAAAEKHGVELDANRAADAAACGISTIQGDLFNVTAKVESFSLLYLNPPYDSEIGSMDNKRMEFLFLEHTYRWLVEGGVLLMVVPQAGLHSSIPLLAENFTDLRVFRLMDPESERFDQVALFGVRKRMRGQDYSRNRAALHEMVWRRDMPALQGNETPYRVPASASTQLVYRGLPLDQIEDHIVRSSAWKQVEALLLPREEMAGGRPITPLHAGHVGLLCTAGLLNGVFGQGDERHIARWRSVKSVTVFEVKEKGYTEVRKCEQFTNDDGVERPDFLAVARQCGSYGGFVATQRIRHPRSQRFGSDYRPVAKRRRM